MSDAQQNLVNYEIMGSKGPTVLLIHGLFGDLDNLKRLGRELESDYRVVAMDCRNHGDSFHSETMTYAAMADDVKRLVDELGLQKISLVGHSMGGKLAMEFALTYPDLVQSLIVADVAPVAYDARHRHILDVLEAIELEQVSNRKEADAQLAEHIDDRGVRQFLLKNLQRENEQYQWRLNLPVIDRCYSEISAGVRDGEFAGPVLFIKGGDSNYLTEAHRDAVTARFSDVDIKIIEGTGHWLHAEKPRIFNRLVRAFLEQHSRT
ncbi:alpha/beta fold hydrolase [Pseudidiomarina terrestris]|uniref:alpha/beta fold hydrolase n=1 Tax=Pseudidiomarina terrestris TaxID=2820060 RepID=UPI00264F02D9|nr:alpha/beta fold hydrolase [Pseudidiomarina sp. 1ASP75-5]MDN7135427.1 alpha/beta fold hydrolase [Pseudidiomarina sp. 1ASP75-5]